MDGHPTAGATASRAPLRKGRVGIIDVGSNSIRLVVYERASRAPLGQWIFTFFPFENMS